MTARTGRVRRLVRRTSAPFRGVGIERVAGLASIYRHIYTWVAPSGLHELDVHGYRMVADFSDTAITPSLWLRGQYEPTVTRTFRALVTPGSRVIDVGAHIGYYSLLASGLAGKAGSVLAVEPDPLARALLQLNILRNGLDNVTVSDAAISNRIGYADFYAPRTISGAGSLTGSVVTDRDSIHRVELVTLDELCAREGRLVPTLMKIDVQGLEERALAGASRLLHDHGPAILCEFNPRQLRLSGSRPARLLETLERLGYALFLIDEELGNLRQCGATEMLLTCLHERADGGGFRNLLAARPTHLPRLEDSDLLSTRARARTSACAICG